MEIKVRHYGSAYDIVDVEFKSGSATIAVETLTDIEARAMAETLVSAVIDILPLGDERDTAWELYNKLQGEEHPELMEEGE